MRISLLSPVYNEAEHLEEMISSVQRQSHEDWELLVADDGSTDGTADIVASRSKKDHRVQLVSRGVKLGKIRAFNLAYAASSGEVVALLGGDDRLTERSLATRVAAFAGVGADESAVAFFKMRTFSEDPRHDGMVLPRGRRSSRSGGSTTMSRALANRLFPIDERLVAEDIWLAYAGEDLASRVTDHPEIVLDYRIHPGNSTPRDKPFEVMTEAIHARNRAFSVLLECDRFQLSEAVRAECRRQWRAERLRYSRRLWPLLVRSGLPVVDRAAMAAMASPALFAVRKRYYKVFSGLRGR